MSRRHLRLKQVFLLLGACLLAIIDFPPRGPLSENSPVKGVPNNRGGHGIPQKTLVDDLTAAGFTVQQTFDDWPEDDYCVIFRKPTAQAN